MSGPGAHSQSRRLPSDMEHGQRGLEPEQMQQQLKLRDRQKFFEEVFQHDVDFFFPMSHLQIEHRRPPLGSISSMEVNVDMLEQMELMDLSDQDTMDVFLSCGTEDNNVAGLLPGKDTVVQTPVPCLHYSHHCWEQRIMDPSFPGLMCTLSSLRAQPLPGGNHPASAQCSRDQIPDLVHILRLHRPEQPGHQRGGGRDPRGAVG
ncbi:dysbindin domain-containing protein 2 isoform X1 [Mauremys reevesii]|uniref:dysbindin domain-containing protein 2 isoform X1 n=1 Tax=Mauremys reevesii TaxID=260615 RepID=UPI00193EE83A|nr:dysbindin domain-containing protein 2 isoform X1 [Mauremys reevesii]